LTAYYLTDEVLGSAVADCMQDSIETTCIVDSLLRPYNFVFPLAAETVFLETRDSRFGVVIIGKDDNESQNRARKVGEALIVQRPDINEFQFLLDPKTMNQLREYDWIRFKRDEMFGIHVA
jgi:hypothetical protein